MSRTETHEDGPFVVYQAVVDYYDKDALDYAQADQSAMFGSREDAEEELVAMVNDTTEGMDAGSEVSGYVQTWRIVGEPKREVQS